MKLGVLDLAGAIAETIELAPIADQLGYHRFWIAEHQPQPSPTLIASIAAGVTERIRVGTAGILLQFYTPRRVAHDFHFLQRVYFGRIDAGFCSPLGDPRFRGDLMGRDPATAVAGYGERVAELVRCVRNTPGSEHYDKDFAWNGALPEPPELWSLGADRAGDLAASNGTCFAYNFMYRSSADDPSVIARYRTAFRPHPSQPSPRAVVAITGMCCETVREATDCANRYQHDLLAPRIVGDAETCGKALMALQERYAADEIIFADLGFGLEARRRGFELLATALDLG